MKNKNRSPLKAKPLRTPGQSVEEAQAKLIEDTFETPAIVAVFCLGLALFEWFRALFSFPPKPVLFSVVAVVALGFAIWRWFRLRPRTRALRQAIEGEKVVGQFLESLRERGYRVFHDLIGEGFNVDHVVIGPAGVFTIETKTWSKPRRGEAHIEFDGQSIRVDGLEPDREPIIQASAQAAWLKALLAESTGKQFSVWPVIVFPGWFVEPSIDRKRQMWILNPRALPAFLDHEPRRLSDEDIALASFHLSRFVRARETEDAARLG
jgi:hypothetical protein